LKRFFALCLGLWIGMVGPVLAAGEGGGWEMVSTNRGIQVERKTMPDSPLFAFRGEGVVNVPMGLLVTVLLTDEIALDWVDLITAHTVVRSINATEKIIYESFGLPWPISDRDYVMRQTTGFDPEQRMFTLDFESVNDAAMPEKEDVVRAMAFRTFWRLKKVDETHTNVEVEVFTDPKGLLPSWLINMIQKDWPWKTIEGLVKRANRGDIQPHSDVSGW
jgi:hypothetical protein